jgi:hypothetical protein
VVLRKDLGVDSVGSVEAINAHVYPIQTIRADSASVIYDFKETAVRA